MSTAITSSTHYDQTYYNWQKGGGKFGGFANKFKFLGTVGADDVVVDFGCGGGFLLANLGCKEKIGIEPNKNAKEDVTRAGAKYFSSTLDAINDLGENYADVIISHHALEHTHSPLLEIKELYKLLKPGGKIHFVVPHEAVAQTWKANDVNFHLYTWSPMNLGNLFTEAGFNVQSVNTIWHRWPPKYMSIARISWKLFDYSARIWARLNRKVNQVEVIASKGLK